MADIATLRPPLLSPSGLIPNECAVVHGLLFAPVLSDPRAAAERPELARTESSEASSIRRRMFVTERKTPGSIGGGVALPGFGGGKGGGGGRAAKELCGESGGEWSPRPAYPRSRRRGAGMEDVGDERGGRRASAADRVAGSRLSTSRDSSSSTGNCSHGPCESRIAWLG